MQSSAVLSCQGAAFSRAEKCGQEPRTSAELAKKLPRPPSRAVGRAEANRQPPARSAEIDTRTRMLLEQPIAPMILRLAIPNATVMTVQILIGLVEVYFVSRTGVAGLAGVAPVFPAGFAGGCRSPRRHRRRHCHDGRTRPWGWPDRRPQAKPPGTPWPWVFRWGSRRRPPCMFRVQTLYAQMALRKCAGNRRLLFPTIFAGATLIWCSIS